MGEKWRPSNGTIGESFAAAWCSSCTKWRGEDGCGVHARTMLYSVEDPEYPSEWQISADGQPECTAYRSKSAPRPARCKRTIDMFAELI
jgi:hypothetical protein